MKIELSYSAVRRLQDLAGFIPALPSGNGHKTTLGTWLTLELRYHREGMRVETTEELADRLHRLARAELQAA